MAGIGWMQKPMRFALYGLIGALLGALCGEAMILAAVGPPVNNSGGAPANGRPPTTTTITSSNILNIPMTVELPPEVRVRADAGGGQKGEIEIALLWNNTNDLDLHCIDPNGAHIFFKLPNSASGGKLDIDQNRAAPYTKEPIEHIRWNDASPGWGSLIGTYRIYVDYYDRHDRTDSTDFTVYLKYPGQGSEPREFRRKLAYQRGGRTENTPDNVALLTPIATFEVKPPPPPPPPLPPSPPPSPSAAAKLYEAILVGLWTLLVSIGLAILLVIGQNRSTNRGWISPKQAIVVVLGAGLTGLVAGGGPQLLYGALPDQPIIKQLGQIPAWAVLGGLLGLGMSRFIPNLAAHRAALAGMVGGAIGALAQLGLGDFYKGPINLGHVGGASALGFAIGLMVALIEVFVREAWLVLHWGPKETTTVNLGATPVILGTGSRAQVRLPGGLGIPGEWATITLDQGKIEFRDSASGKVTPFKDGSELRVGNLRVEVRTAGSTRP